MELEEEIRDLGLLLTSHGQTDDNIQKLDLARQICRIVRVPPCLEWKILQQISLAQFDGAERDELATSAWTDVLVSSAVRRLHENALKSPMHRIAQALGSNSGNSSSSGSGVSTGLDGLMSNAAAICNISREGQVFSSNLVETDTTIENIRRLTRAVELQSPILVQGEVGCGKSFLIRELAGSMGQESTLVELHLDDQTDSKTLLGAYVCSDVPGELLWQPGVITQAALSGRWLIIEDVDKAPLEVAAALSALLERRRLYLPERGREVPVHRNFRLFGTRSLSSSLVPSYKTGGGAGSSSSSSSSRSGAGATVLPGTVTVPALRHFSYFWHFVTVELPSSEEIRLIVTARFPILLPVIVDKLFETYGLFGERNSGPGKATGGVQAVQAPRLFTLRDLMKAARRCASHSADFNAASGVLTDELRRRLLGEVVDVFAASVRGRDRERGIFDELVYALGRCWGVADCDIEGLVLNSHPQLHLHNPEQEEREGERAVSVIGRVVLESVDQSPEGFLAMSTQQYSFNRHSLRMLEQLAACVSMDEPVLLVGETGSGKTSAVQELANILRRKLLVQNLSLSTDATDLFGGFRPVSLRQLFLPCYEQFLALFQDTFSSSQNSEFVLVVAETFRKQQWKKMLKAFVKASANATQKLAKSVGGEGEGEGEGGGEGSSTSGKGGKGGEDGKGRARVQSLTVRWGAFRDKVERLEINLPRIEVGFAFAFMDGLLVDAMRKGYWVLLDEVNLAASETLQALAGVLDGQSLCLTERGDMQPVPRHPEFRIFAAMNPPTDVGKKELPVALRSRFTELYSEEITDPQDLRHVVEKVLSDCAIPTSDGAQIDDIVSVYLGCRASAEVNLSDGAGQRPRFSLRSLTRSLKAAKKFIDLGMRPLNRALLEGFLLNFHTLLVGSCRGSMWTFLKHSLGVTGSRKELAQPPSRPGGKKLSASDWELVKPFWLRTGSGSAAISPVDWAEMDSATGLTRFVLTPSVEATVRDLAAAVSAGVAPILIQGPTSAGKTSVIEYLAARTGHKCVRINNHEHTDVQEYVGGYVTSDQGHLEFRDGLLVDALRLGYWIILDGACVCVYACMRVCVCACVP